MDIFQRTFKVVITYEVLGKFTEITGFKDINEAIDYVEGFRRKNTCKYVYLYDNKGELVWDCEGRTPEPIKWIIF